MDKTILIPQKITQKELDDRWEFNPEYNWVQAPKYPIKFISSGQRELYSASKFSFDIKDFWEFILLTFFPILLFSCFDSLNYFLNFVDLSKQSTTNWNDMSSGLHTYWYLKMAAYGWSPIFFGIEYLIDYCRKYKKAFFYFWCSILFHIFRTNNY